MVCDMDFVANVGACFGGANLDLLDGPGSAGYSRLGAIADFCLMTLPPFHFFLPRSVRAWSNSGWQIRTTWRRKARRVLGYCAFDFWIDVTLYK
jgi:hypothetical protein